MKGLEARIDLASILAGMGIRDVTVPDISSKAAAQRSIGLDMESLIREKEQFKKEILPLWDKASV